MTEFEDENKFMSNREYFKQKELAQTKAEKDKKRKKRNDKLKHVIITIFWISFFVLLTGAVTALFGKNYLDNRDFKGIENNVKNLYDEYQQGMLINEIQVSQDCKITIHKQNYLTDCSIEADTENVACENEAIHEGYWLARGEPNMTDGGSCKIR